MIVRRHTGRSLRSLPQKRLAEVCRAVVVFLGIFLLLGIARKGRHTVLLFVELDQLVIIIFLIVLRVIIGVIRPYVSSISLRIRRALTLFTMSSRPRAFVTERALVRISRETERERRDERMR